jgi:hypothetical protein
VGYDFMAGTYFMVGTICWLVLGLKIIVGIKYDMWYTGGRTLGSSVKTFSFERKNHEL